MKLIKPKGVLSKETFDYLSGKKVECVREIRNPIAPTTILWVGETEDGFFRAAFAGGAIMMIWDEIENVIRFGLKEGSYIGVTERAMELLGDDPAGSADEEKLMSSLRSIEVLRAIAEDAKNTKFTDVMKLVKWKFKNRKVKVETEDFSMM